MHKLYIKKTGSNRFACPYVDYLCCKEYDTATFAVLPALLFSEKIQKPVNGTL